jgi:osmotically inducible protein OsmC
MALRKADARWEGGGLKDGHGTMKMAGWEGPFTFKSRFEEGEGTNPEALLAAAHAGCFSMALAADLEKAGHTPESVETTAAVELRGGEAPPIRSITLTTRARVPGISEDEFQQIAEATKSGCPVSQALAAVPTITVEATLES